MAVTTLSGSPAHNVIASSATAAVNLRILVGDTVASATEHVRKAIADDSITPRGARRQRAEPGLARPTTPRSS